MKVNVRRIAELAGVSPGTVSNALNGRKGVGEKARQEILAIARELGYTKGIEDYTSRKNLRFVIYKRHGFVVSDTPFFSALMEGIEKEARGMGYEVIISHINPQEREAKEIIETISRENTAGLLILATEMQREDLKLLEDLRIPVVLLDSGFRGSGFDMVLINNMDGAYKATAYLAENGHRRIGYLHSSVQINNFNDRKSGYEAALQDYDLPWDKNLVFELEPTMEGAYKDMVSLLDKPGIKLPSAFFADNDIIAFGAIRALKEGGVRIPEELSIVGFDDMPFCEITSPRLTTIKVHKQGIGSIAVKRLLEIMEGKEDIVERIEIDTELVVRESVCRK